MRYLMICLGLAALLSLGGSPALADSSSDFFNGKDTTGWEGLTEYWKVDDGAIVGSSFPDGLKFNTFLCSKRSYKDFELKFQVRLKGGKGNSGVQVRSEVFNKEKFAVKGPQCDMGEGWWGSLYGEQFGGMMKAADKDKVNEALKKDGFNEYYVKCVGKHITIRVNGVTTVDEEFPKMPDEGIIAWQMHGGGPMEVTFKNIVFKTIESK